MYCIAHHDADSYFLPNCRFDNSLLGNIEELLQKLAPLCINTCTVSIHCSIIDSVGILFSRVAK